MARWEHLLESRGDKRLRDLERRISQGGSLEDWAEYRRYTILTTGEDPVGNTMRRILGSGDAQAHLKRELGLPQKLPVDLEGEFELRDEGRRYRVIINRSKEIPARFMRPASRSPGGVGSRIKIECLMCGQMVGASMSAFGMGGHLKKKGHGTYVRRKQTIDRLKKGILNKLKKAKAKLGYIRAYTSINHLEIITPPGKEDGIVAFMQKHYGDKGLQLARTRKLSKNEVLRYGEQAWDRNYPGTKYPDINYESVVLRFKVV